MSVETLHEPVKVTRARGGRPDLHNLSAHPRRTVRGAGRGSVASCRVTVPAKPRPVSPWLLRLKVAVVGGLAVLGGVIGVSGYVSAVAAEPVDVPVAGDPAWAHVEP